MNQESGHTGALLAAICLAAGLFFTPEASARYSDTQSSDANNLEAREITVQEPDARDSLALNKESADSTAADKPAANADNRNILLNAESATVPREINIGLPETGGGAIVYVDGARHAQDLCRSQFHWAGGNAYEPVGSINLMDAIITTNTIGIHVDSWTRLGGQKHSGKITAGTSSNGLIHIDAGVSGPLSNSKGLYYSVGAYVNYDPTNVNAPTRSFVDQKQIYQAALTKRWTDSELSLLYRFSLCDDNVDGTYNKAPFTYNGDGSISTLNGFRIGKDCYFPADDALHYMEIGTGQWRDDNIAKMDHRLMHDITLMGKHHTLSGWDFNANLHVFYMQPSRFMKISISGIDDATASSGFTLADGSAYTGPVQNRFAIIDDLSTCDVELVATAQKQFRTHKLRAGLSLVYADQEEAGSTVYFAHTVTANPDRLYKDGQNAWNYNKGGMYFKARKYSATFWAIEDWNITKRLLSRTGLKAMPVGLDLTNAPVTDSSQKNKRVDGFNIADSELCELQNYKPFGCDVAVSEHLSYRILDGFFATAEGFWSMNNKNATYYKGSTLPSSKPIGNALVSGGFTYDNKWLEATAVVTYITSWNNSSILSVSKQVGGVSETIPWTAEYGIGTLGVTLDGTFKLGGFRLHALFTWQDPRYKDYSNEFVFSDGSVTKVDYSGKYVTGISQIMAELDPSYSWKRYKVWASFRYYSRQYASRTNYAYFNGHFESFAGFDMGLSKSSKISVNLVNILFQNGVKGTLDIADTIDDPALLEGYRMAGSYIRPFSIEFSYTYSF